MNEKAYVFGPCADGQHSECMVEFKEMVVVGGTTIPAWRCTCDCGHSAQKEREVAA